MTVVNKHTHTPTPDDVYIGRGSRWGNPFIIGRDGTRADVIGKYDEDMAHKMKMGWVLDSDLLALKDKNLVCYCAPKACHGDVLERLITEIEHE